MNERWIVIPRWDEFQHRDMARSSIPPWIKNLTRLLHDDDYLGLTQSQRGILHGLWLLYASHRRVLSEAGARQVLVRSEAEARYWRGNIEALNHADFIEIVASRPARHLASLEVEVELELASKALDVDEIAGLGLSLARTREGLPFSQLLKPVETDRRFDPVLALLDVLPDADEGTETVFRNLRLPEFAYRNTAEQMRERQGGVKLAVTILKRFRAELDQQQQAIVNAAEAPDDDDS